MLYTLSNASSIFTYEVFIGPYIASRASSKVIIEFVESFEIKKLEGHAIIAFTKSSYFAQHFKVKPLFFLFYILECLKVIRSSTLSLVFFITTYLTVTISFTILRLLSFIKNILVFRLNLLRVDFWFTFFLFLAVETIRIEIVFFFCNVCTFVDVRIWV